ncbi:MAG TPA: enoyl-ACP reductase FabI [Candidatus Limnocylindria bacterium]|jgi:enoyl-[acyl-carrier protein] reductase I
MLLDGKKVLVTGVLTDDSIAFSVAKVAQEAGAEIVLTSFGRAMSITQRVARRLDPVPDVLELDVNQPDQIAAVAADLDRRWGRLDGLLHAIGFAPQDAMGGGFLDTPWESASVAFQTSAYSLKALTAGMLPLLKVSGADGGASVVSLTFDARYAWPIYDWMGVAKAGLESITRYLARDLGPSGIRVNTVSAGPIRSMAGKNIPGFGQLTGGWGARAPLGWEVTDSLPVGRMVCFLMSDWASLTTGEMIHVDGGFHALGIGLGEADAAADPD